MVEVNGGGKERGWWRRKGGRELVGGEEFKVVGVAVEISGRKLVSGKAKIVSVAAVVLPFYRYL